MISAGQGYKGLSLAINIAIILARWPLYQPGSGVPKKRRAASDRDNSYLISEHLPCIWSRRKDCRRCVCLRAGIIARCRVRNDEGQNVVASSHYARISLIPETARTNSRCDSR